MIRNYIFDFGNVLGRFDPKSMTAVCVPDPQIAEAVYPVAYDRLYWDYVSDVLNTKGKSDEYMIAAVKAAKKNAKIEATGTMLKRKGSYYKDKDYEEQKALNDAGIKDSAIALLEAELKMIDQSKKYNESEGSYSNEEIIAAVELMPDLTNRQKYYLYKSFNDNDKNNPWKAYK